MRRTSSTRRAPTAPYRRPRTRRSPLPFAVRSSSVLSVGRVPRAQTKYVCHIVAQSSSCRTLFRSAVGPLASNPRGRRRADTRRVAVDSTLFVTSLVAGNAHGP